MIMLLSALPCQYYILVPLYWLTGLLVTVIYLFSYLQVQALLYVLMPVDHYSLL